MIKWALSNQYNFHKRYIEENKLILVTYIHTENLVKLTTVSGAVKISAAVNLHYPVLKLKYI